MNGMRGLASIFVACALASVAAPARSQQVVPSATPDVSIVARGSVYAIAKDPSGGTIIGGLFTGVAGVPRSNLARLAPDGSVDPAWAPRVYGVVRSIAVDASGDVFVAGDLRSVDGITRIALAKIRASGVVDPDWAPEVSSLQLLGIAVDGRGGVIIIGAFSSVNLVTRHNIARLYADGAGALDLSWAPVVAGARAVAVGSDGSVFVAAGIGETGSYMRRIMRISPQGAASDAWGPLMDDPVFSLVSDMDGKLYAAGTFTLVGGFAQAHLVRLSETSGEVDATWRPSVPTMPRSIATGGEGVVHVAGSGYVSALDTSGGGSTIWSVAAQGDVFSLLARNAGNVLAGGNFFKLAGDMRLGLAHIAGGALVEGSADVTSRASVNAILAAPDGGTYVGGFFHKVGGEPRYHAARFDADGGLDPDWQPSFDGVVNLLAKSPDGGLYAAGGFSHVGTAERSRIAKLDPAGAPHAAWRADISGTPFALAVGSEGDVFVGGSIHSVQGIPRRNLAKMNGQSGALDLDWNPAPNDWVTHLAVHGDSVYVAGAFHINGSSGPGSIGGQPRELIAKLHASGPGDAHAD